MKKLKSGNEYTGNVIKNKLWIKGTDDRQNCQSNYIDHIFNKIVDKIITKRTHIHSDTEAHRTPRNRQDQKRNSP